MVNTIFELIIERNYITSLMFYVPIYNVLFQFKHFDGKNNNLLVNRN